MVTFIVSVIAVALEPPFSFALFYAVCAQGAESRPTPITALGGNAITRFNDAVPLVRFDREPARAL